MCSGAPESSSGGRRPIFGSELHDAAGSKQWGSDAGMTGEGLFVVPSGSTYKIYRVDEAGVKDSYRRRDR